MQRYGPGLHMLIQQKLPNQSLTAHIKHFTVNYCDQNCKTTLMKLIIYEYDFDFIKTVLPTLSKSNLYKKDNTSKTALDYCFNKTKNMNHETLLKLEYDKLQLFLLESNLHINDTTFIEYLETENTKLFSDSFINYKGNNKYDLNNLLINNLLKYK